MKAGDLPCSAHLSLLHSTHQSSWKFDKQRSAEARLRAGNGGRREAAPAAVSGTGDRRSFLGVMHGAESQGHEGRRKMSHELVTPLLGQTDPAQGGW